jgi:hypothetical protein
MPQRLAEIIRGAVDLCTPWRHSGEMGLLRGFDAQALCPGAETLEKCGGSER